MAWFINFKVEKWMDTQLKKLGFIWGKLDVAGLR